MAHHVHRATGLGAWVLINENWYYPYLETSALDVPQMLLSRHAAFEILGELARLHNKKIVRHISAPVLLGLN